MKVTLNRLIAGIEFTRVKEKAIRTASDTQAHAVTRHMFSKCLFNSIYFALYGKRYVLSASLAAGDVHAGVKSDLTFRLDISSESDR